MTRRIGYIERRERDSATFDNTYQALDIPIDSPAIVYKIVNNSTINVDISIDGVTDHDFLPAFGSAVMDVSTNGFQNEPGAIPSNTQFYVKGAAAGVGSVYLVVLSEQR